MKIIINPIGQKNELLILISISKNMYFGEYVKNIIVIFSLSLSIWYRI